MKSSQLQAFESQEGGGTRGLAREDEDTDGGENGCRWSSSATTASSGHNCLHAASSDTYLLLKHCMKILKQGRE